MSDAIIRKGHGTYSDAQTVPHANKRYNDGRRKEGEVDDISEPVDLVQRKPELVGG